MPLGGGLVFQTGGTGVEALRQNGTGPFQRTQKQCGRSLECDGKMIQMNLRKAEAIY